jgi:hypothetical protein
VVSVVEPDRIGVLDDGSWAGPDPDVAPPSVAGPFVAVLRQVAAAGDVRDCGHDADAILAAAGRVAALGIGDYAAELDALDAGVLFHHAADVLAGADPRSAWAALQDALSASVPGAAHRQAVVPLGAARAVAWLPVKPSTPGWTVQVRHPALYGWGDPTDSRDLVDVVEDPLPGGFGGVRLSFYPPPVPGRADDDLLTGPDRLLVHGVVILLGLLGGTVRRLVLEAYAHARLPRPGGTPLWQHQAVAIRLGEVAVRQQALRLLLHDAVAEPDLRLGTAACRPAVHRFAVAEATWIARESLQVAAGHGYVGSAPLRVLTEQVRVLAAVLAALTSALPPAGGPVPGRVSGGGQPRGSSTRDSGGADPLPGGTW